MTGRDVEPAPTLGIQPLRTTRPASIATVSRAITHHLRSEIIAITVRGKSPWVNTLSLEVPTSEAADSIAHALAAFTPKLIAQGTDAFVVKVDLSGGSCDIAALLHAIQDWFAGVDTRRALIDLDGRIYLMDRP